MLLDEEPMACSRSFSASIDLNHNIIKLNKMHELRLVDVILIQLVVIEEIEEAEMPLIESQSFT